MAELRSDTDASAPKFLRDKYAIIGVGETAYTRRSGRTTKHMAVEAVRHGAVDFVQKPFDDELLVGKVTDALSASTQQHVEELERNKVRRRVESLTARERQVMTQVVEGKANKVIASDLGVSQRTVEIHRSRVMEKMQAASLAQLVRMVLIAEADI